MFVQRRPSRRRLALVDPLVADAEARDYAPPRQGRVERLAVGLPADNDVAGTGLGDGIDQGRFLGGGGNKGEARRRGEDGLTATIFGFRYEND